MLRLITSCPLPGGAIKKLKDHGFINFEDIYEGKEHNPESNYLLRQWELDDKLLGLCSVPATQSALDLWQEECVVPHIVTFSKAIDDVLGGGIAVSEMTELCGAPGSGKTQMCLQLSVDVQIPKVLGGLGGEALFIESSCGFVPERLKEIANACISHCEQVAFNNKVQDDELNNFTESNIMKGIHYISVLNHVQLVATVYSIRDFVKQHTQVKLIVVDSLVFPFRDGVMNSLHRTRLLCCILKELQIIAQDHKLAVVITNQLTTKVGPNNERRLMPAFGESFGQYSNRRIMLGHLNNKTYAAVVFKSVTHPQLSTEFQILSSGIRDTS